MFLHVVSEGVSALRVSESNGSSVFVEMLRGRDGLPGRDGMQGPPGPAGPAAATFECVDADQESLPDSVGNTDGALFYHVETNCGHGHLPRPRYEQYKELNCVVCTK